MNRPVVFGVIAALLGGITVGLQAAALANVGRITGSIRAGLLTYAAGGAVAAVLLLASQFTPTSSSAGPPRGAWLIAAGSGVLGLVIVSTIAYSTSRVTVAAGLAIMLIGQLAAALVLDAAGLGVLAVPVDARRVLGVAVIGLGAWLLLPRLGP